MLGSMVKRDWGTCGRSPWRQRTLSHRPPLAPLRCSARSREGNLLAQEHLGSVSFRTASSIVAIIHIPFLYSIPLF